MGQQFSMSLEPGKYKVTGMETTNCAGNSSWPVYKFKIKLNEDGTMKGKKKFEEAHNSPKQKCKVEGTWDADSGKIEWQYDFEWNSGAFDHYEDSVVYEDADGDGDIEKGDAFQGVYNSPTAGSSGTLSYTLHKMEAFSSSDDDYE